MSEPIYLLLGIHNHQPVGNFGSVFEKAFERCYMPVLDAFERHPSIRFSIHHSGPLLDWAAAHEGNYIDRLVKLAGQERLEILGGGYYEPILPILKPGDALGQIEMMQRFWEKGAGKRPRGMWLAERVWEPSLAALLNDAGMSFTILDDQHFRHAGIADEMLFDYWRTERAGKTVSIFPSDKTLRYFIPFKEPEDVIGHLLRLQERHPGRAVTYGDDGEKFGIWPGTFEWVIQKGWLERFLALLEQNKERIATITFSDFMAKRPPAGTIYLPTASYSEMLEWAMPAPAILSYERTKKDLERAGLWDRAAPFFRGGFWDNFLTKYPESNLIHKRCLYTSDRLDAAEAAGHKLPDAREALYRAQCNCAYWHGLFGGLYLNYLRHALYENLIEADAAIDRAVEGAGPFTRLDITDLDRDGFDEAILSNETISCVVRPSAGGSLASLDYRPKKFNLLNTLARRFEAYHEPKQEHQGNGGGVASIHDIGKDIGEMRKLLTYDRAPRYAFLDHAFASEPNWDALSGGGHSEIAPFESLRYKITKKGKDSNGAFVSLAADHSGISIEKELRLARGGSIEVNYTFRHDGKAAPEWLATEINFTLLAGDAKDRYYQWSGIEPSTMLMNAKRTIDNPGTIDAVDRAFGFRMRVRSDARRAAIMPVETVSQCEEGFERLYQGSTIWLAWKPAWSPSGEAKFSVGISIESI